MEKSAGSSGAKTEVSIKEVVVKKEHLSEDIKDFAETAMNELLGWYGYDNTREDPKPLSNSGESNPSSDHESCSQQKYPDRCGWCGRLVDETTSISSASATFCSELCFSQSRRANFKKTKTCDWCRHVRHTVSYVDSQDGSSQLQFCSDKCLNQYKIDIFCRETSAHLKLHPHAASQEDSSSNNLITPDLWLKNCKSPDLEVSSPKTLSEPPQTSPLSLITVAPSSKLMPQQPEISRRNRVKFQKKARKRVIIPQKINSPEDLRVIPPKSSPVPAPAGPIIKPLLPPPTILLPYPIFLPVPIPLPIPIPLINLNTKEEKCTQTEVLVEPQQQQQEEEEEILDVVGDSSSNKETVPETPSRPLRKRKKIFEVVTTKSLRLNKQKKIN